MKMKHYRAPDMRQALRLIREAQGPDAIILSSKRIDGGVEVVAAVDYDNEAQNGVDTYGQAPAHDTHEETYHARAQQVAAAMAVRAQSQRPAAVTERAAPKPAPQRFQTPAFDEMDVSQPTAMGEELRTLR